MKEPDCGGCKGQGAHSRRCRTNPGWFWYRLEALAEELGDNIGSNDPESANMAYAIQARMKARAVAKATATERTAMKNTTLSTPTEDTSLPRRKRS